MTKTTTHKAVLTALYTWAYDGSGVALRTGVEILPEVCDFEVKDFNENVVKTVQLRKVRFTGPVPPLDRFGHEVEGPTPDTRFVSEQAFTGVDTYAPLASFNWLD